MTEGIWWFTKMLNRVVGEERYDAIRVQRRVYSNKFYYLRQQVLYRWFVEHPDVANLLGVYPKVDSSHGFGFYSIYWFIFKTLTKCTEISKKTPSTVMVLSGCGSVTSSECTYSIKCITTLSLGIGARLLLWEMERRKESEWRMPSPQQFLKKVWVFKLVNGAGIPMISTPFEEDCLRVWAILTMWERCTCRLATENTDMSNTTDTESETRKLPWFKGDFSSKKIILFILLIHYQFIFKYL